jgi:hypothetical protein
LQGFDDSSSLSLQKDTPAFPDFYALLLSEFIFSGSTNYPWAAILIGGWGVFIAAIVAGLLIATRYGRRKE